MTQSPNVRMDGEIYEKAKQAYSIWRGSFRNGQATPCHWDDLQDGGQAVYLTFARILLNHSAPSPTQDAQGAIVAPKSIAELEKILNSEEKVPLKILPDGTCRIIPTDELVADARNEALEEAAKVADRNAGYWRQSPGHPTASWLEKESEHIAQQIRALASHAEDKQEV